MTSRGQHTFAEIMSQATAWSAALAEFQGRVEQVQAAWDDAAPTRVLFTGCGSTYYLSLIAASILQGLTGIPARGVPASELVLFPHHVTADPGRTLLVAISRSGTTSETIAAVSRFRQMGGRRVWCVTCYPDTPLAQESDLVLPAEAAQEESVAQTRSFSTMLVLVQALAATVAHEPLDALLSLPPAGEALLEATAGEMEVLGNRLELCRYFFLGSGPQYGVACEAMLKLKEMSITHSEAYHALEFRHGPKAMVDGETLAVGLLSRRAFDHERAVLMETGEMAATILALSPAEPIAGAINVQLPTALPEWTLPPLYLPPLQLLAYHRAMAKGLDPDRPRHLEAVVVLDPDSLA